jgi:minichromosome maintenance protein 10
MSNPPLSPTPLRKSSQPSQLDGGASDSEDTDEDEDEEMLKLKLQRIEAKLKLKKLQKQQRKKKAEDTTSTESETLSQQATAPVAATVLVPLSPSARRESAQVPPSPKSPSRVLLGIDKGLKGRDVSLRRAPQYRRQPPGAVRPPSPRRPAKTFSQRLAEERVQERTKYERQRAIEMSRSNGFGLGNDGGGSGNRTLSAEAAQQATHTFTSALSKLDMTAQSTSSSSQSFESTVSLAPKEEPTDEAGFDSFSGLHLLRRTTPHATVARHLSSKTIFQLPQLLKTVISPSYEPPEVEGDWITIAVICSKSEPRNVGQNTNAQKTDKKYMVMQLTDLKWEIELFLFGAGFERFWKLPVGTVIALLNPGILKPRNADSGRFSLTLADDGGDSILEIGVARDLGFCKSVKRDGKQCGTWVDARHTHFCAFHVEQTVKKARVGRAEVNSMGKLFSPPKKGTSKPRQFGGRGRGKGRDDGLQREGPIVDLPQRMGGAGGNVFIAPGRSTAALLDDEDYLSANFHRGTKDERLSKRLEEGKKEKQLTKRIIEAQGREGGIGTQYLKTRIGDAGAEMERNAGWAKEAANRKQVGKHRSPLTSSSKKSLIRVRNRP